MSKKLSLSDAIKIAESHTRLSISVTKELARNKNGECLLENILIVNQLYYGVVIKDMNDCAHRKPLTLEIAKQIAYTRNGKCISEKYVNSNSPLFWKCKNNHQFHLSLSDVKNRKSWCHECMKLGLEFTQNLANERIFKEKLGVHIALDINMKDCVKRLCQNILNRHLKYVNPILTLDHPTGLELDIYYLQYGFATEKIENITIKDFINPCFLTTPFKQYKLSSFIETHSGPGFVKSNCLYFYKEELQNICKLLEFDDEQKTMALKLIEKYKVDKKECAELIKTYENQVTARSIRSGILKNRLKLLANTTRSANSTTYVTFTQVDISISGHKVQKKQITTSYDFLTTDPNPELSQGIKCDLDNEVVKRSMTWNEQLLVAKETKKNLKLQKNDMFEEDFAIFFVNHIRKCASREYVRKDIHCNGSGTNSKSTFHKKQEGLVRKVWETCLRASAEKQNSQKTDNERCLFGEKIDTIITLRNDDEEFSVTKDRLKIIKISKTLMNQFAKLRPNFDIRTVKDNSNEDFQGMTTRTVYTSKCMKREKKARTT
ncbi:16231_t:CDS:10 [Gigaspora margarita]|uniref:16231_t:CDS:1 n=1 Tax=Gigaspora margarita TaxID=4874 RepID=A0ABN7VVW0_GIGMA|nr:16231_t:CDS:10 [Gigaspora margarita]